MTEAFGATGPLSPAYYFLDAASAGGAGLPGVRTDRGTVGDLGAARADFPALHQRINGRPLVWFDNAATTQKPRAVLDAMTRFYERDNSNVHRGAHTLAARATDAYEDARASVARLLGASSPDEIVFVRGTTEGVNLLAATLGRSRVRTGDEIVLTTLEHHANIVPWQLLAQSVGARLRPVPVDDSGQVQLDGYAALLTERTKIVALSHVSNALGTVLPIDAMIAMAKARGIPVVVDGAQAVAHLPVDVTALGADFYVFSGHKIFGPTGIGAIYGRRELLAALPPWQGGGSMIRDVTFEHTTYSDPPARFEAGTPSIGDAVGLGAAIRYVLGLGMPAIAAREDRLGRLLTDVLSDIPGIRVIGTAAHKVAVASFLVEGMRTEEVGRALDGCGFAVRSGHHCAQPALRRFGVESTVRASLAFYNTDAEVHAFGAALRNLTRSVRR
ncbi:SufS family cysteine desulfurase [Geodermatophilus amargosae]|uniref:SufS family cysteine desulfurase n=1 Tax=Geodermatophilus amargosae TaxID=1296565 RepID=UPI0034DE457B